MSTVLFVCRHNAGRSQMSQALFERAAAQRLNEGEWPSASVVGTRFGSWEHAREAAQGYASGSGAPQANGSAGSS